MKASVHGLTAIVLNDRTRKYNLYLKGRFYYAYHTYEHAKAAMEAMTRSSAN